MKPRQVWMHPWRAARRINELEKELAEADGNYREARRQGRQQADTLRDEAARARGETERVLEQLGDLREKHENLRRKVSEEMQRQATLFTDRQSDMEELKAGYERRLEHLRHALADARALLAERTDYDALRQMTLIDMAPSVSLPSPPDPSRAPSSRRTAESTSRPADWLEPLPD